MDPRTAPATLTVEPPINDPSMTSSSAGDDKSQDNNPDNLVNLYKRTNYHDQQRLLSILAKEEFQILYEHYLTELNAQIERLEAQSHPSHEIARALYNEIETLRTQRLSDKRFSEFSHRSLFDAIHKSIAMLNTVEPNNSLRPEFFKRSAEFTATANDLHREGRNNKLSGIFTALQLTLVMAAVIAACVMSVVTYGFSLTLLPMLIGGAGLMGLVGVSSGIRAHSFLTQGKKEQALAEKMYQLDSAMRHVN